MNKYEMAVDDCIDKGNCLANYPTVYQWFCYDNISNEIWEQFALTCFEELAATSNEVYHKMLCAEQPSIKIIEIKL